MGPIDISDGEYVQKRRGPNPYRTADEVREVSRARMSEFRRRKKEAKLIGDAEVGNSTLCEYIILSVSPSANPTGVVY